MSSNGNHLDSIVVRVVGPWTSDVALATAVAQANTGFIMSGGELINSQTKTSFPLLLDGHELKLVARAGSVDRLLETVAAIDCLLTAQATDVKIPTSDLQHSAEQWIELSKSDNEARLLKLFVNYTSSGDESYSYGMQCLGLRDVVVDDRCEPEYAKILMKSFVYFVFLDEPSTSGHATFRTGPHDPVYQMLAVPCATFLPHDSRFNPVGMWQLRRT